MLVYPHIEPVAFKIGILDIHWYALAYMLGICSAWLILLVNLKRLDQNWNKDKLCDLVNFIAIGIVLGGRLGYVVLYNFKNYVVHPISIIKVWEGGMSFHGGLIGAGLSIFLVAIKYQKKFLHISDFVVPVVPIGLGAGRLGNFVNAELWGKVSDTPWAIIFPTDPEKLPRHPSQIYQFLLEGLALFIILHLYSRKVNLPDGYVTAIFLLFYSIFRFTVEFVRVPDIQLGYIAFGWLTMGQILCIPMVILGLFLLFRSKFN